MSKSALDLLYQERDRLYGERQMANIKFTAQIEEIESAIEKLGGILISAKPTTEFIYEDESPDYVKMSQEEI